MKGHFKKKQKTKQEKKKTNTWDDTNNFEV